jgi:DsbC/DsbD-like thiol-disulfide interchange protein
MTAQRLCVLGIVLLMSAAARAGHVKAELLADVPAIQAGKPFWLGVRFTIDPGWHVYWKNPGDSGLPTRVKFNLPDGFTAGALQFPVPHRLVLPGDIVSFGYENSVILLAQITPPETLPADFQGNFQADVSWLVCSDVCIPGKDTVSLTLPSGTSADSPNRELFDDWIGQLPVNSAESGDVKSVASSVTALGDANPTGRNCSIKIIWNHAAPDSADLFPEALDDYNLTDMTVKSAQDTTVIGFTLQPLVGKTPAAIMLDAVVGYDQDGKRRGINISVALPMAQGNNH